MSDRYDEIRKRLDAATPGPWSNEAFDAGHSRFEMTCYVVHEETGDQICDMDGLARSHNEKFDDDGYADSVFIANAREDVAWLLDQVLLLKQERDIAAKQAAVTSEQLAKAWESGLNTGIGYKTALGALGPSAPEPTNPYL